MNTDLMFSSKTDDWATPQDFYDKLNEEIKKTNEFLVTLKELQKNFCPVSAPQRIGKSL